MKLLGISIPVIVLVLIAYFAGRKNLLGGVPIIGRIGS